MPHSREFRVFISSTFRDLQPERDHLSKKVFPTIRALCRERGVEFTEIDLRWGLTEEEAHNGLVIRSCLEEIDNCRPYFIGIVGSRYGWVPEHHIIQRDPDLLRHFPWVEDAAADRKSIIEMEFDYGALADPEHAECAYFYLPQHRSQSMHKELAFADDPEKLEALKQKIRTSGLPYREYAGQDSLGEHIYNDLVEVINRRWPAAADGLPLDRERRAHEAFAANRRHAYIANPDCLRALNTYATGDVSTVMVVTAPSGAGKSALLSYWTNSYHRRHPDAFVIEHYIGVSTRGNDEHAVLAHIFEELKDRFTLEQEIPTDTQTLVVDLPIWLARAQRSQMVIVVDALNQLDDTPQRLSWIPEHLPETVKLILSTTDESMFVDKKYPRLEVAPLSVSEREAIIVRFLSEYHKSLPMLETKQIANDPKTKNPLFLRTLLEEIRLFGSHDELLERVKAYLSAADLRELFQLLLERMEADYGPHIVRDVMTCIWASRRGLSEVELASLVKTTRPHLDTLLVALDYHLLKREDRLGFFHEYLREAVEMRYLNQEDKKKKVHKHIADFLSSLGDPKRRSDEEPWQWQQSEEWEKLRDTLVNIDIFLQLSSKEHQYSLLSCWRSLRGKYDLTVEYEMLVKNMDENSVPLERQIIILRRIADFLTLSGLYPRVEHYLRRALELASQSDASTLTLAEIQEQLGNLYFYQSNFDQATQLFTDVHRCYLRQLGERHKLTLSAANSLGLSLVRAGKSDEGVKILVESAAIFEKEFGSFDPALIELLTNIAVSYWRTREFVKAKASIEKAISIVETSYGKDSLELAIPLSTLGLILRQSDQFDQARKCYHRSISLYTKYFGSNHPRTAIARYNLAISYLFQDRFKEYISIISDIADIYFERLGIEHFETLHLLGYLSGEAHRDPELRSTASKLLAKALSLCKEKDVAPTTIKRLQNMQVTIDSNTSNVTEEVKEEK